MALTKADMAERLYDELGLNKREAKELVEMFFEEVRGALESRSNSRDLEISIYDTKINVRDEIPKREKKSLLVHGV